MLIALIVALFTSSGEIDVAVDQAHAPKTAANFLTATASFFICIGDQPSLDDGGHRSADHRGFAPPIAILRAEIRA